MSKKTHSADSNSNIEWSIEAMKQAFYDASEHCEEVYKELNKQNEIKNCLLYTSPSPRDPKTSRMPSSA